MPGLLFTADTRFPTRILNTQVLRIAEDSFLHYYRRRRMALVMEIIGCRANL